MPHLRGARAFKARPLAADTRLEIGIRRRAQANKNVPNCSVGSPWLVSLSTEGKTDSLSEVWANPREDGKMIKFR